MSFFLKSLEHGTCFLRLKTKKKQTTYFFILKLCVRTVTHITPFWPPKYILYNFFLITWIFTFKNIFYFKQILHGLNCVNTIFYKTTFRSFDISLSEKCGSDLFIHKRSKVSQKRQILKKFGFSTFSCVMLWWGRGSLTLRTFYWFFRLINFR